MKIFMLAIRESIGPRSVNTKSVNTKSVNTKSVIDITTPEPGATTRISLSRKSLTRLGRLSLMCFVMVGAMQLIPQTASAQPRTGPTKYQCAWKNEYVCTAAPGGGGKLSKCHTERV